jgi:hypothetical protein
MFKFLIARLPHLQQQPDEYTRLYRRVEVPAKKNLLREGEISRRSFF